MQEMILEKMIFYAPAGIFVALLLVAAILAANLRQMKKINKRLSDTLGKAEDYFKYILEETEEETEVKEGEAEQEKSTKTAEDVALLQDVLMEYFP
ncbi:MAG: hypothetical protein HFI37_02510 [Lachnospiraceae bacterium]|nr:hypothetical protein [Lachnospiraceae bacterium]